MKESLKKKTISAMIWSFSGQWFKQGAAFVIALVLARLLEPEDFGVLAMITVFTNLAMIFINFGFSVTIIQKKNVSEEDLSTIFWVNIAVGILLTLLFLLLAPAIGALYNMPELVPYTRALAANFVIGSTAIVQRALFMKAVNFKTLAWVNAVSVALPGGLGMYLALTGHGVWSLVWYNLCSGFVSTLLLWFVSRWRPRGVFSLVALRGLLDFSLTVFANKVVMTISQQMDKFLLGKFVSPHDLGLYNRGESTMNLPVRSFSSMLSLVLLSVFSKMQEDDARLRRSFAKILDFTSYLLFPCLVLLAVYAEPVILVLLTEKWLEAAPFLQLFCLIGLTIPIDMISRNTLVAKGHPDLLLRIELARGILLLVGLWAGLQSGVVGLLVVRILVTYLVFVPQVFLACRLIEHNFRSQGTNWLKVVALNILLAAFLWMMKDLNPCAFLNLDRLLADGLTKLSPGQVAALVSALDLVFKSTLGLSFYLLSSLVIKLDVPRELAALIRERLRSGRKRPKVESMRDGESQSQEN